MSKIKIFVQVLFLIPMCILIVPLALIGCILLSPFRLFDWAFDTDTDWSNSPYSFIASLFKNRAKGLE